MSRWISRHKRSIVVVVFLVAAASAYLGYQKFVAHPAGGTIRYVTQTVGRETLVSSVSGTGNMVLEDTYSVQSPVSGTVEKVSVNLGDTVKLGQTLFVVSSDKIDTDIANALSSYNLSQSAVLNARAAKLQAAQKLDDLETAMDSSTTTTTGKNATTPATTVTETDIAVAEDQLAAAKIALNNALRQQATALSAYQDAQAELNQRVVKAPNAGVVTSLSVAVDDTVSGSSSTSSTSAGAASSTGGSSASGAGSSASSAGASSVSASSSSSGGSSSGLVVLSDVGSQAADVTLNETDIASVKVGQKVNLTFDALPDLTLTGKVERIATTGTNSSGVVTYDVIIKPDLLDSRVRPGMTVSAAIITQVTANVLTVPSTAIKTAADGSTTVEILVNGAPQTRTVQTGASDGTSTAITSGLSEGDRVVTQTIDTSKSATTTTTRRSGSGGLGIFNGGGGVGGPPGVGR